MGIRQICCQAPFSNDAGHRFSPIAAINSAEVIVRLGGWKGFASQRSPGAIILYEGWVRFFNLFDGWAIAKNVYKR
jgi:hypothetical protein